jgi:hypothetical protein
MPVIPALRRRLKQEDSKFQASKTIARPCFKK